MSEESEQESTRIDEIWELKKLDLRFMDILDMISDLKAKDKSLSARIARLKLDIGGNIENLEEEPEEPIADRRDLENMSIEERALLYAKLLKMQEGVTLNE